MLPIFLVRIINMEIDCLSILMIAYTNYQDYYSNRESERERERERERDRESICLSGIACIVDHLTFGPWEKDDNSWRWEFHDHLGFRDEFVSPILTYQIQRHWDLNRKSKLCIGYQAGIDTHQITAIQGNQIETIPDDTIQWCTQLSVYHFPWFPPGYRWLRNTCNKSPDAR